MMPPGRVQLALFCLCILTLPTRPTLAETGSLTIPLGQPIGQTLDTVRKTDTSATISKRIGCPWPAIVSFNRWPSLERPPTGTAIRIPKPCKSTAKPNVSSQQSNKQTAFVPCSWTKTDIDSKKLKQTLDQLGFQPPAKFRALIVETTLGDKTGRAPDQRVFDYGGLSYSNEWNPASTIKIFPAAAAAERLEALGFNANTNVTFHYDQKAQQTNVKRLFHDALHRSDNIAHNQLVDLAGFRHLNGPRGTIARLGLEQTFIMRAYAQKTWKRMGRRPSLRTSPQITLQSKDRGQHVLAEQTDGAAYPCKKAACSTPNDLAQMMCRTVLHEQLPPSARLRLQANSTNQHSLLSLFRRCLFSECGGRYRKRPSMIKQLRDKFFHEDEDYFIYRKAGYSLGWRSENLVIEDLRLNRVWTITLAAYGGESARAARKVLEDAMEMIARIIYEGYL